MDKIITMGKVKDGVIIPNIPLPEGAWVELHVQGVPLEFSPEEPTYVVLADESHLLISPDREAIKNALARIGKNQFVGFFVRQRHDSALRYEEPTRSSTNFRTCRSH